MCDELWELSFARAWEESIGESRIYRIAHALKRAWGEVPLSLLGAVPYGLAGSPLPRLVAGYGSGCGVYWDESVAAKLVKEHPEVENETKALRKYFADDSTLGEVWSSSSAIERAASNQNVYWAGGWGGHIVLDYASIIRHGTTGLRRLTEERSSEPDKPTTPGFFSAMRVMCDLLDLVAARYSELAETRGYVDLADVLTRVPTNPCTTWEEAVRVFWLVFGMDGYDSPGRFDVYMRPYYDAAISEGRHAEAYRLLDMLWVQFERVRAWNLCVGGVDSQGDDSSSQLSLDILELAAKYRHIAPNLTMRIHPMTPPDMWKAAMTAIASGCGMPALYNDDVVIPSLVKLGIPISDARDYCMNGCNQIDIQGKSHMGLEDGELSLVKCVELALRDGYDPATGEQLGPHTGDPRRFSSINEVLSAVKMQVAFFIGEIARVANRSQEIYSRSAPDPLRTLLIEGCLEKGLDVKSGGPLYNHGQVLIQGIGNSVDSIAAIDAMVFKTKCLNMDTIILACDANWAGYGREREIARCCPKFGNDDERVDWIATELVGFVMSELKRHHTFRGGIYAGGCSPYVRGVSFGHHVGATPDGRLAGTPLADSAGPVQGNDMRGPTGMLSSTARVDASEAGSGYIVNLKLAESVVCDAGWEIMAALVKGYFAMGGQQLQVTVVDEAQLRRAQENPDEYPSLIVRVGGFSEYFVRLDRAHQDDIISRMSHAV